MKLQDLKAGMKVENLLPNQIAEIVAVKFHGENFAEITYKDEGGNLSSQIITAEQFKNLNAVEVSTQWKFTADAKIFRLTSEAYRLNLAYLFEPYLAVYSSLIEPLPHQISAVYEKMLTRQPLRFVLADDPGAGKTIMAGLLIKELTVRGDVKRCLIVCPGALVEQWRSELQEKFHLDFEILTGERINLSLNGNIFADINFGVVSIDILSRNADFKNKLAATDWDLIICDEAHKMSATVWGNDVKYTKRFKLGQLLGKITRHFLLLTATPHNGKETDFYLFMSLIDSDRFEGAKRIDTPPDVSDLMRRLVKEDLLTFEGKKLFPERLAYTVNYNLSAEEMKLYELVTDYVSEGFNRAERLTGNKKSSVGFAMTILQRRLASSPKAIYKSLERRTERLKKILREKKLSADAEKLFDIEDFDSGEDFPSGDFELKENELAETVTTAKTLRELQSEIQQLENLTEVAKKIFQSGRDKKWSELSKLLQDNEKLSKRDKLIIFTEHRDTLDYLQEKISALFGRDDLVATIHGGMNHKERANIQELFKHDKNIFILLATDAAGEGINLQNAHLMINYDLPWNPNRLEQRFGRIHRIGQKNICHLWNLVATETREGQVFNKLLKKLEEESAALGGKVFDILGKISFDNKPLRELLIEAVRYGNNPEVKKRLDEVVDKSFDADKLKSILRERSLTAEIFNTDKVFDINKNLERGEVHKLQPYFIETFFVEAFQKLGGQIYKRGNNRYEIVRVPSELRNQNLSGAPVQEKYKRICFDKKFCNLQGADDAILFAPGHNLLTAVNLQILKNFGKVLKQGTIFIDDNDDTKNFRLLFYVETKITDAAKQVLSKKVYFIELADGEKIIPSNSAPYLDYNFPTDLEREKIFAEIKNLQWLQNNLEDLAINYTTENFLLPQLQEVETNRKNYLDKLQREVEKRLENEISFWDMRSVELAEKDKLNSDKATSRVIELTDRLKQRTTEIELSRKITMSPPVVIGGALIVPRGYFAKNISSPENKSAVEKIAMQAVMKIEIELGNKPVDVSDKKCGYDIESVTADGKLRFIEVKGRNSDADTITVTQNEILTAFNAPENFILAIVRVDKNSAQIFYLQQPFTSKPDFNAVSVNYKISALLQGKVILTKNYNQ